MAAGGVILAILVSTTTVILLFLLLLRQQNKTTAEERFSAAAAAPALAASAGAALDVPCAIDTGDGGVYPFRALAPLLHSSSPAGYGSRSCAVKQASVDNGLLRADLQDCNDSHPVLMDSKLVDKVEVTQPVQGSRQRVCVVRFKPVTQGTTAEYQAYEQRIKTAAVSTSDVYLAESARARLLEKDVQTSKATLDQLGERGRGLAEDTDKTSASASATVAQVQVLQRQLDLKRKLQGELQESLKAATRDVGGIKEDAAKYRRDAEQLVKDTDALKKDNQSLRLKRMAVLAEVAALDDEVDRLEAQQLKLTQDITQLEEQLFVKYGERRNCPSARAAYAKANGAKLGGQDPWAYWSAKGRAVDAWPDCTPEYQPQQYIVTPHPPKSPPPPPPPIPPPPPPPTIPPVKGWADQFGSWGGVSTEGLWYGLTGTINAGFRVRALHATGMSDPSPIETKIFNVQYRAPDIRIDFTSHFSAVSLILERSDAGGAWRAVAQRAPFSGSTVVFSGAETGDTPAPPVVPPYVPPPYVPPPPVVVYDPPPPPVRDRIKSDMGDFCAYIERADAQRGKQIQTRPCMQNDWPQQWEFVDKGGGSFMIRNKRSQMCWDVWRSQFTNGTNIILWHCDDNAGNQRFRKEMTGNGSYVLTAGGSSIPDLPGLSKLKNILGAGGKKCVDVQGGRRESGRPFILYDCHREENQRWTDV